MEFTAEESTRLYASGEGDLLIMQGMVWRVETDDLDYVNAMVTDCEAFLMCENIPTVIMPHPIITAGVPSCERCADILTR
jgi:hypothetical protein